MNKIKAFIKYLQSFFKKGSKVPIQFADTDRIEKYEDIAVDFFSKIIEMNYYDCFISDESSLHDFCLDDEKTIEKIRKEYGIEPDKNLVLADIFEQINNEKRKTNLFQ